MTKKVGQLGLLRLLSQFNHKLVYFYQDEQLNERKNGIVYWVAEVLKTIHPIEDSRIRAIAQRFYCWNRIEI